MPEKNWAAQRANAGNRPDIGSHLNTADDIFASPKRQAAGRISRRFCLAFATAATIAELARLGGAQ